MKFCSECGLSVSSLVPEGDNRLRYVCEHCNTIHYQNPRIVTGCLPVWEDKVLLCKRAIEPRYGLWTLPAGFMENEEAVDEAAARESFEEANANIEIEGIYTLISLPHVNQVYILYLARLLDLDFHPGTESLEVELFLEEDIPWNDLAFHTINFTLEKYFQDRKNNHFPIHTHTIQGRNGKTIDNK